MSGVVCEEDALACEDIPLDGVDPEFAACDNASTSSSIVFADPEASGEETGARDEPFADLGEAIDEAQSRGSQAVILGGEPTFEEALDIPEDVSTRGDAGADGAAGASGDDGAAGARGALTPEGTWSVSAAGDGEPGEDGTWGGGGGAGGAGGVSELDGEDGLTETLYDCGESGAGE